MRAVPTETICFGETSMSCTSAGGTAEISVVAAKYVSRSSCRRRFSRVAACGDRRTRIRSFLNLCCGVSGSLAWATT